MPRPRYVAARDPRHRLAVLALYRALLRSARRVPLPDRAASALPPAGPLAHIIRARFSKNRPYTSLRLIYASLAAGYRFLTLLAKARTPASPDHAFVLDRVRSCLASAAIPAASPSPSSSQPSTSQAPRVPLISNIAPPGSPPTYRSSILPRPRSSFQGPRRIPVLCTTANGLPFLRMKKPQPSALSSMVGRKDRLFANRVRKVVQIDEQLAYDAALEDEWDRLVDSQQRRETAAQGCPDDAQDPTSTFSWSVQLARLWWEWKLDLMWEDWLARGRAYSILVEEERSLAEQEKMHQSPNTTSQHHSPSHHPPSPVPPSWQPNVEPHPAPALPLLSAIRRRLGHLPPPSAAAFEDPFLSPAWHVLVQSQRSKMLHWLSKKGCNVVSETRSVQ